MAQYYTAEEAVKILAMPLAELMAMVRKGDLRSLYDGAAHRFRAQDIDELSRSRGMGSDEELGLGEAPRPSAASRRKREVEVFDFNLGDEIVSLGDPPRPPPQAHRARVFKATDDEPAEDAEIHLTANDGASEPLDDLPEDDGDLLGELQEAGYCRVVGGAVPVASSSVDRPLLIGSHPRCTVHVPGPGVAPMHCFLTWLPKGLYLFDLNSGQGTLLDNKPIVFALVRDGQTITLGSRTLTVELKGTPTEPAAKRKLRKPTTLAVTAFQGKHKGQSAVLACGQAMSLGQAATSDLRLDAEKKVLPRHLGLKVEYDQESLGGFVVRLRRLSRDGTVRVNAEEVKESGIAHLGDLIHFSASSRVSGTALLLHYDLDRPAW